MRKKYRILSKISDDSLQKLLRLSEEVRYSYSTGSNRRTGQGRHESLSLYHYSKWFKWTKSQREIYSESLHKFSIDRALQCWFLKFDPGEGFLDTMDYWVNEKTPATIWSTALLDNQTIIIDDEEIVVKLGETIVFDLNRLHSVPISDKGQKWACVMIHLPNLYGENKDA